ncbi:hypothetical protein G6F59_018088 [Rhizopus arrhizus]|nr:hypothetical protein G6F59_018088 [Rhizopus arrhizus]
MACGSVEVSSGKLPGRGGTSCGEPGPFNDDAGKGGGVAGADPGSGGGPFRGSDMFVVRPAVTGPVPWPSGRRSRSG